MFQVFNSRRLLRARPIQRCLGLRHVIIIIINNFLTRSCSKSSILDGYSEPVRSSVTLGFAFLPCSHTLEAYYYYYYRPEIYMYTEQTHELNYFTVINTICNLIQEMNSVIQCSV
ncbi:Hypothetical_protein [Hexamita inflata]|uniref:Hypothetical_protein n=1 Tax=Hexamita inflata TaxID=28002 RepID=A0ABP1GIM6_9EUKA